MTYKKSKIYLRHVDVVKELLITTSVNVNRAAIKYYYLVNFNIDFNNVLLPACKVKSRYPTLLTKEQVISIFNMNPILNINSG